MSKLPALQFYIGDWLKDPKLSMCSPATRGIWMDLLCAMHELDRSGLITGTTDQLARLCRCTAVEISAAIAELKETKAADVTERNGNVTVANRRMQREAKLREDNNNRVRKHRGNAPVTEMKRKCNTPSSSSASASVTNVTGGHDPPTGENGSSQALSEQIVKGLNLWDWGWRVLTDLKEKSARNLLGAKIKEFSEEEVVAALRRVEKEKPAAPSSFFCGVLKSKPQGAMQKGMQV